MGGPGADYITPMKFSETLYMRQRRVLLRKLMAEESGSSSNSRNAAFDSLQIGIVGILERRFTNAAF
jgi:hypothetical protein